MKSSPIQRIICLLLFVAYAAMGTSVVPAAILLAASIDDSHEVSVSLTEQGAEVRLHHRAGNFTPRVEDHSCFLGRLVVSVAYSQGEGDHEIFSPKVAGLVNTSLDDSKRVFKCDASFLVTILAYLAPTMARHHGMQNSESTSVSVSTGSLSTAVIAEIETVRLRI